MASVDSRSLNLSPYFDEALDDAERMLKYGSEVGLDIDEDVRNHILRARFTSPGDWNQETAANLLTALAKLATRLRPITAESLRACSHSTRHTVRRYWRVGLGLALRPIQRRPVHRRTPHATTLQPTTTA
jgi:hypothetical protein